MISFHFPDVEAEHAQGGLTPYLSECRDGTPALLRADFQPILEVVRRERRAILASDPEILGARVDFLAARKIIRKLGGRLLVQADLQGEMAERLFDHPGLRALAEGAAGDRPVRVFPISESPHEEMTEHCCAPRPRTFDIYLRARPTHAEVAREILRATLYQEGYPVFIGPGAADAWTDVFWNIEIARRMGATGFDPAPQEDLRIGEHKGFPIHGYAESDLLAAYVLRRMHPTHLPEERDAFLERVQKRNPQVSLWGETLVERSQEGALLHGAQTALAFFVEVGDYLDAWSVSRFHVTVPAEGNRG